MTAMVDMRWLDRLDERFGDTVEAALSRHHRRRLGRLGWGASLDPPVGESWWSPRATIRAGNSVEVLIDGASAFEQMQKEIRAAEHSVHIAGWHSSPDFELTRGADAIALRDLLAEVAERIPVRLLLWAGPPLPAFQPTRSMVARARDEFVRDSLVQCALDKRERTMHCHHEKIVIVDGTLAFVGGVDFTALEGDRHDEPEHPPRKPMGWHDAAIRLRGPAVADVAAHFNSRWSEVASEPLPEPLEPARAGDTEVQVLRTVPEKTYGFLPKGEFTILDAYLRALRMAERFIYLENQFLWSPEVVDVLADRLQHPPCDEFRILLVLPTKPSDGKETTRGQLGRLLDADDGAGRLLATTITATGGDESATVYIHAKIAIIDDRWLTIGSGNLNEHSLFNDTEMNLLTCDAALARETRLRLWSEHLERSIEEVSGEPADVIDRLWRPTAVEQRRRLESGAALTHRLRELPGVSRRAMALLGPLDSLVVDG
jgi:phosphatidylserine/phosphatidylglycerophosphate/cardiolipin synthase-like enzyme